MSTAWSTTTTTESGFLWIEPQNSFNSQSVIESPPSADCNISVAFHGSYGEGLPNGPGQFTYNGGQAYGIGFTVFGSVASGGIGHIMADANPKDPGGAWTIEQWNSSFTKINGVVSSNGGPATPDLNIRAPYETNGNQFRWYDHPGLKTDFKTPGETPSNLRNYEGKFYLAVKVVNGSKQCEVKFRLLINFSNGSWSYGRGAIN